MGAARPYAAHTSASRLTTCRSHGIASRLSPRDCTPGPKRQVPSDPCTCQALQTTNQVPRGRLPRRLCTDAPPHSAVAVPAHASCPEHGSGHRARIPPP